MGLYSPMHLHLEQVKQNKTELTTLNELNFPRIGQPPQNKPYVKGICKPTTIARKKVKLNALYKLSKFDITRPYFRICPAIFSYRLS
jgi:hypothetical protein